MTKFKQIRCKIITWSTHRLALPAIRILLKPKKFPYTIQQLKLLPQESLGAALLQFLENHQLHLLPDYESHDVKHALLGYPATEEGEASLQYFFLGNGQRSFPVLITVLVTFLIMPEYHNAFKKAYIRGKSTPSLGGTNWFSLLDQPTEHVLKQLSIKQR